MALYCRRKQEERGEIPSTYSYNITPKFKNKFVMFWQEYGLIGSRDVCKILQIELGVFDLCTLFNSSKHTQNDELIFFFLKNNENDYLLTVIELAANIIRKEHYDVISKINFLFQYDRIGYKLIRNDNGNFVIINIEDSTFYDECTDKCLGLLSTKKCTDAQIHYIESYKKLAASEYGDSLVEIGRAIESVIKTRLTELSIQFDPNKATLNHLLDIAQKHMVNADHDFQYFKQVILDAGRARNKHGGHGHAQGQTPQLDETYVRFVINQAAANLLFLAEVDMQP